MNALQPDDRPAAAVASSFFGNERFFDPADPQRFAEDCERLAEDMGLMIRVFGEFCTAKAAPGSDPAMQSCFQLMALIEDWALQLHEAAQRAGDAARSECAARIAGEQAGDAPLPVSQEAYDELLAKVIALRPAGDNKQPR